MTMHPPHDQDVVTRLISFCHRDIATAWMMFDRLIAHREPYVDLPDGGVALTEKQLDEFVKRFNTEVEPHYWDAKRRKN